MAFVYANAVGMRGGAFDLSLEFGYSVPPGGGEDPQPPEWKVRVGMSWEHAQAMYELLGSQIARYEEQVGSIPDISKLKQGGPA
jgi:hypothetical protein